MKSPDRTGIHRLMLTAAVLAAATPLRPAVAAPVSEIVIDARDGATLFSSEAARVRPPASLTKMMTLLLAFDAVASGRLRPGDRVVMTAPAHGSSPPGLALPPAGRSASMRR